MFILIFLLQQEQKMHPGVTVNRVVLLMQFKWVIMERGYGPTLFFTSNFNLQSIAKDHPTEKGWSFILSKFSHILPYSYTPILPYSHTPILPYFLNNLHFQSNDMDF